MKKQLLIAAVAASMTSVAMADISISGAAKINYTTVDFDDASTMDTDTFKHEMDLKIAGKNGDTSVVINFGSIDATTADTTSDGTIAIEDAYVSTTVEGVKIKAGQWDNGNNALRASGRSDGKFSASYTMQGVTVAYDAANLSDESVKISGSIAGVSASYKQLQAGNDVSLATTIAGVKMSYLALNRDAATTDRAVFEVSGTVGGVSLTAAKATTEAGDAIDGDTWMGDFEGNTSGVYMLSNGQDVTAVNAKMAYLGNTVQLRRIEVDGVTGEDSSITKVVVTRPLGNGTTFEATYSNVDDKGSTTTDGSTLDLELAVKF
jgi:hypothetical protein